MPDFQSSGNLTLSQRKSTPRAINLPCALRKVEGLFPLGPSLAWAAAAWPPGWRVKKERKKTEARCMLLVGGLVSSRLDREFNNPLASTDHASLFHTRGPSGKRRRATSGGLDRRHSARMGVGALFAQHAACSAASTRPPHARALGMSVARLPTWPGCAWQAPARHR